MQEWRPNCSDCLGKSLPYVAGNDFRRAIRIPLQVGATLRIGNNGEIIVDNPELEPAPDITAAGAVLSYQFDAKSGEHILRLLDPVADHKHLRTHRRDD
jgi:hypothetical protein